MKKLIAIALLVASTGAAALPNGVQDQAIYGLEAFGLTPAQSRAVDELRNEKFQFGVLQSELTTNQNWLGYYQAAQTDINTLRLVKLLNEARPAGAPVWGRQDWRTWNTNRAHLMHLTGIGANTYAEEARLQTLVDDRGLSADQAAAQASQYDRYVTETEGEIEELSVRRGYGGTRSNGGACIVFNPHDLGFAEFYCP